MRENMINTSRSQHWNEWCLRPRFCTVRLHRAGDNLANVMNFVMNHAPGAGLITRPVDQQSSATTVPRMPPIIVVVVVVIRVVVVVIQEKSLDTSGSVHNMPHISNRPRHGACYSVVFTLMTDRSSQLTIHGAFFMTLSVLYVNTATLCHHFRLVWRGVGSGVEDFMWVWCMMMAQWYNEWCGS